MPNHITQYLYQDDLGSKMIKQTQNLGHWAKNSVAEFSCVFLFWDGYKKTVKLFVIQIYNIGLMRPQENQRQNHIINFKGISQQHTKSGHSATSIRSTKQYQQPLLSRQRQNNRTTTDHSRNKKQQKLEPTLETTATKLNPMRQHKVSNSEVPLRRGDSEQQHHVLINVNIQDLVTPRNAGLGHGQGYSTKKEKQGGNLTPKIEGGQVGGKPVPKVSNRDLECLQFQCNEEIVYRRASPPPRERTVSRQHPTDPKPKPYPTSQKPKPLALPDPQKQNPEQLLSKYTSSIPQLNSLFASECLSYLDCRQQLYRISPTYIEDGQPNFTWKMRACVVEWMMEVSEEFSLKRETFHIAVNLADRYFEREGGLAKSAFQAIAAACLFIASKLEEFECRSSEDFAITTGRLVTATKLKQTQRRICQVLQYNLNPPTLYRWANRLMLQWDSYITEHPGAKIHPFFATHPPKHFKQSSQQAYINYRLLLQLIDCSTLDIQTSQYSPKLLVLSFIYLHLLKQYKFYTPKQIATQFPQSSLYLFDEENLFNSLYNQFLQYTFGFVLQDLLPTIQYCAMFLILPPNIEMPAPARKNAKVYEDMGLEQYESFQTFDKNMVKVVMKRKRNVF